MGPVRRGHTPCSVSVTAAWGTAIVLVICFEKLLFGDENTVVKELFPHRSSELRGTHISGSGVAFGDSSVLGVVVSSEISFQNVSNPYS